MALRIRLRRMGRKKAPTYRIVVAESLMPRDGRFVANLGHYNPRTEPVTLVVDRDRALHWISKGATPTDTVRSLLKRAGVFGPAPTVTEQAAEQVAEVARTTSGRAKAAAASAASAAAAAAETVKDAAAAVAETVAEAVDTVREAVTGEDESAGEEAAAPVADEPAAEEPAAEEPVASAAASEEPAAAGEPAGEDEEKAAPAAE